MNSLVIRASTPVEMFLLLISIVLLCLVIYQKWHLNFWRRCNLPFIQALPIVGNVFQLIFGFCCFGEQFKALYDNPKVKHKAVAGIHVLFNHALLIREPELIKRVLIEDFRVFCNRFETTDAEGDSMGSLNLFFATYSNWKEMHRIFTPFFAVSRVKKMYPLMVDIALKLETHFYTHGESFTVEVKELSARFTTDIIASLAFGIVENSFETMGDLRRMCIEVNDPRPKRLLHLFVMFFFPAMAHFFKTHLYSPEYENFMRKLLTEVMEHRIEKAFQRGDLIDAFVELSKDKSLPPSSIVNRKDFYVAHAAFLLLAGFDTSSSTIAFALYELAKHTNVQEKVRAEILSTTQSDNGSIDYEEILKLDYLDCVVKEVLRLYPPTAFLDRCCSVPEGFAMTPYEDYVIPFGMPVYISVLGLHHDEKYWPNAMSFMPERFQSENMQYHTPMTYLPFGAGPRGCIGTLLGTLQVKLGLIYILKNFRVEFCNNTQDKIKFAPKAFVLTAEGGIHLKFIRNS